MLNNLYWRGRYWGRPPYSVIVPARVLRLVVAGVLPAWLTMGSAEAQDVAPIKFTNTVSGCAADCFVSVYAGRYVVSEMPNVFGPSRFIPPHKIQYGDSGLIAATFGRPVVSVGQIARIEFELGTGARFGDLRAVETWGAIYFRWTWFPWNSLVRTSIAVSTGLNYASRKDEVENLRASNGGEGSRLMHFLSPEITFGLPARENIDFFIRFHHRSGGRNHPGIHIDMFNGAGGGAQYLSAGIRYTY